MLSGYGCETVGQLRPAYRIQRDTQLAGGIGLLRKAAAQTALLCDHCLGIDLMHYLQIRLVSVKDQIVCIETGLTGKLYRLLTVQNTEYAFVF